MDISFSCVCPVIDNVITKFMISNRTDKRKTDVNLLNMSLKIILHVKIIQT